MTGPRGWWWRRSLRVRLTAAATVAVGVGLGLAAVLLVARLDAVLTAGLDDSASLLAHEIASRADLAPLQGALPNTGDAVVQVIDGTGRVRAGSANVLGVPPLFNMPPVGRADPASYTVPDVPVGDARGAYLVVALPAGNLTVYVGVPTDDAAQTVHDLVTVLAVGVPGVVVALGLLSWLLIGRALRPVEAMRGQAADITVTNLHRRLSLPPYNDEIHRLGQTLNDLLDRLDTAADRQRQFIADAAHELRSPVATLRTQLEVAVAHPASADWSQIAPDLLTDLTRLSRLVDDLVRLARLDAAPALRREPIDLDDVVFAEIRRMRGTARVPIRSSGVGAARVRGDQHGLEHVVQNLLDNAVRHAASRVTVQLTTSNGHVDLVVADDGPGIPEADRKRVFERFTRLDISRNRDPAGGGAGLGLAIVSTLTAAHGGRAWIEDNRPGARVHLRFPATL